MTQLEITRSAVRRHVINRKSCHSLAQMRQRLITKIQSCYRPLYI